MDAAGIAAVAAIEVAGAVELHAIRIALAAGRQGGPDRPARQQTVRLYIEDAHMTAFGVVDEQALLVAGEAKAIGLAEIAGEQREISAVLAHPIDATEIQLQRPLKSEVLGAAIGRVGEIDPAVALHHDVVGAVQLLALVVRGQHGDGAVMLRPRHPAGGMLASEHPAAAVIGVAVRLVGRLAERLDAARCAPAAQMVAGDIAEGEVLLARMPDRPFGENEARTQSLKRGVVANGLTKAVVMDFHSHAARPSVAPRSHNKALLTTDRQT